MILLTQNTNNIFAVTVSEKKITDTDYYLFEFTNDTTRQKYYTVLVDTSDSKERYNQFTLPLTPFAVPESGSLNLSLTGFYQYAIYENSGSNYVSSSDGLNVVETGKAKVLSDTDFSLPAFTSSYNPNPVFDPTIYGQQ
jgi:hypothetical protein